MSNLLKNVISTRFILCVLAVLHLSAAQALSITTYPHARVVVNEQAELDDYRLTLGTLKKIDSEWVAENERRLAGELKRQVLELSEGYGLDEAYDFYQKQLLELDSDVEMLFDCSAWRCGSSNAWANARFGVRQLYGMDQYQRFGAFRVADEATRQQVYLSIYAVTRGNKRSYILVDQLTSLQNVKSSGDVQLMEQHLLRGASLLLPSQWQGSTPFETLAKVMSSQPDWYFAIVGLDTNKGTLAQQKERSINYAQALIVALEQRGISKGRLTAEGLGGLVPDVLGHGRSKGVYIVLIESPE